MRTVFLRPRDKKIAKNTAKTALLATAALAMPYAVTPSPLTVVCTAATAMVQNRAFHDFRAVGVPLAAAPGASYILEYSWLSCCTP